MNGDALVPLCGTHWGREEWEKGGSETTVLAVPGLEAPGDDTREV
jgi:hypothetical protein